MFIWGSSPWTSCENFIHSINHCMLVWRLRVNQTDIPALVGALHHSHWPSGPRLAAQVDQLPHWFHIHPFARISYTYDFSSCFFPKFKKSAEGRFSREMTYFFGFYGPKIGGGGSSYPAFVQKYQKP